LLAFAQLESLLAPIALYPDQLLAQVLAASTYPLEIVEVAQWLKKNSSLQGEALVQAAAKNKWDPSIQALVVFPDIVEKMSGDVSWTTAVGNAFLAQQNDVMDAIQVLRKKAYEAKALQSNAQQKVELASQQGQTFVTIEPADPQVVYVPSYNPTAVYGPAPVEYPYPVMAYPSTGAAVAAGVVSFGAGIALGAAFSGCCGYGWGWNTNWGAHDVNINNNFVRNNNLSGARYGNVSGRSSWAHNPANRGAVPYSNAAVAGRYGGSAARARTPYGAAGAGASRAAAATPLGSAARAGTPGAGRGAAPAIGATPRGSAERAATPAAGRGAFSSADRVGAADRSAFNTSRGGDWARSSSARGNSSMGRGGGGGGGFRGGGGGGRGGGGRGRR
jgi:uncharacterized membrane protein YgcG